jgi:outer membrane protein assembly factor BamE
MFHHIATPYTMSVNPGYRIPSALKLSVLAVLACMAATGLTACSGRSISSVNPVNWITPYRIDVIQGNFVSKEQVDFLKAGMTRAQVKDVLGTPLLSSLFHADRWDYVFTLKRQGTEPQSFKYTVFFKGDALERFEGDTMPSDAEFIATLANGRKLGKAPVLVATEEQLKAAEKPSLSQAGSGNAATPAGSQPTTAAPVVYPPLEGVTR